MWWSPRMTGEARADVQRAIAAEKVQVDGEPRSKSFRLRGGERVTIEIEGDAPLAPEGPSVPIRYEDESSPRDREARRGCSRIPRPAGAAGRS